jgi:hypothetical protein
MVKMQRNMIELNKPTDRIVYMATCPFVNTEIVTSEAAMIAARASSFPALILCRSAAPKNRPIIAPPQYSEMYFAASPKAARYTLTGARLTLKRPAQNAAIALIGKLEKSILAKYVF